MANKRNREIWAREEKQRKYNRVAKKFYVFPLSAFILTAVTLLLFFVNWALVYNTDMAGAEVKISGFNVLFASLGGNYDSAKHGDMAVPFYYYAKSYCESLGVLTAIAFFVLLANLVSNALAFSLKAYKINAVSALLSVVEFGLLLACFIVALSMKNSEILSKYCSNNPACSIRSTAIVTALCSAVGFAISAVGYKKYLSAKATLK